MIEERYLAATQATNLLDSAHAITQVDVIKASGMSRRNLAAHYLRLISKPTREDMERMYAALLHVVQARKLQSGPDCIGVAIEWLLTQNCNVCSGTGVVTKHALQHKCPKCHGSGKRREPGNRDAQLLIDYVADCRSAHAGRMKRLLK
ncbi:hypothetical protein [Comamonas antarctica]|uniref:hypothetical protein n=1 Tax=Comamonas antarctica TaxID=2743470 RepID=UPI0028F0B0EC|nr:hypothetical protein [Comamonas antarctica]